MFVAIYQRSVPHLSKSWFQSNGKTPAPSMEQKDDKPATNGLADITNLTNNRSGLHNYKRWREKSCPDFD